MTFALGLWLTDGAFAEIGAIGPGRGRCCRIDYRLVAWANSRRGERSFGQRPCAGLEFTTAPDV